MNKLLAPPTKITPDDKQTDKQITVTLSPPTQRGLITQVYSRLLQYQYTEWTIIGTDSCTSEFLISFEAWAKLAQQWLMCAALRIHLEPIN